MQTLEQVKTKLRALFGDTTVPAETTRDRLEEIRDMIDDMLDTLPEDDDDADA